MEPTYFVAIIGSRTFYNKPIVEEVIKDLSITKSVGVVSGGAKGVDTWAEEFCKKNDVYIKVLRPIDPSVKINYLYRNVEILTIADEIIAFWDGKSTGTKFVIDYATSRGKRILVYNNKGERTDVNN